MKLPVDRVARLASAAAFCLTAKLRATYFRPMRYDFDHEILRDGTSSVKWELIHKILNLSDDEDSPRLLPMWVADMDFPCLEAVVDALVRRAGHPIYGYTFQGDSYRNAAACWMQKRHRWEVKPEWLVPCPGIVPALNFLVRTFTEAQDKVIVQPPVYYPFFDAIRNSSREILHNPLVSEGGKYHIDFEDLEEKARDPRARLLILSNPHNPVGRVWTRDELARLGAICRKEDVLVIADEIHGDLIHRGHRFTPFASLSDELADNSITCTAPSKTFNLAGLQVSTVIIKKRRLRAAFEETLRGHGIMGLNTFAGPALEAAYTHGEDWLNQLLEYLEGNLDFMTAYVAENLPNISMYRPEGTYLVWLDCRGLGMEDRELSELITRKARVVPDEGHIFGPGGKGHMRLNIACPRSLLAEALDRIREALPES